MVIRVEEMSVCMNYDLLKKLERSLNKSNPRWCWIDIEGRSLVIRYQNQTNKGIMEIFELPSYQVDLLKGLPVIVETQEAAKCMTR